MQHNPKVLVVEDEADLAELMALNLRHSGFSPKVALDSVTAQSLVARALPDVILLDWMLPGVSGVELAKSWRSDARTKHIPILMVTAKSEDADKIKGLDMGADDYITKPFSMQELMARIRAVLRRRAPEHLGAPIRIGELEIDAALHSVKLGGLPIKMGPTEFKLLNFFMHHPERVHTRAQLLDRVWGDHVFIEERTVDVHIKRLRELLGSAGSMIATVRGVGYQFTAK